jgi:hypothetical protein
MDALPIEVQEAVRTGGWLRTDNASTTDSEPKQWQVATAGEDAPLSCTRSSEELFDLIINIMDDIGYRGRQGGRRIK